MNLTTIQLAEAVDEWVAATLTIHTYNHEVNTLREQLPIVVSSVQSDARQNSNQSFPHLGNYEQTYVRTRVVQVLLLVEPEPSWDATQLLYGYVDTLAAAILRDNTLGGRVHTTSQLYDASYDPPEVEYSDGTVARAATMTLTIGEVTEV